MKKLAVLVIATMCLHATQAQKGSKDSLRVNKTSKTSLPKKDWSKVNLGNRSADHFMFQYGADFWSGTPDSVRLGGGLSRHLNFYFMIDKPFKNNKKLSIAYGLGLGSSNMFFDRQYVDVKAVSQRLPFRPGMPGTDSANFDKFKLTAIYAELPVEIRYYSNPENTNKSWKLALGVKVGTLLKAYTKGKNLESKTGASIYGPTYILKESNKRFVNGTKIAVSGRVGYGIFSLHGEYNILGVFRENLGPSVNNYQIGLCISGL
jgi:Outer membrane protein beta-barrel domain